MTTPTTNAAWAAGHVHDPRDTSFSTDLADVAAAAADDIVGYDPQGYPDAVAWAKEKAKMQRRMVNAKKVIDDLEKLLKKDRAELAELKAQRCETCLSMDTCYIGCEVQRLDGWKRMGVGCGDWEARP